MSEGDMERAVELYLDMGGGSHVGTGAPETASSSNYRNQLFAEDDIREAIPARYDQLLGDPLSSHPLISEWVHEGLPMFQDEGEVSTEISEQVNAGGLGELYGAPLELNVAGSLEDAMKQAKESSKWLLVNIQSEEEFASFVLNRDVWSHKAVREVIMSAYVFFQREKSSAQGKQFAANHNITSFPVVCVVDPRTGRKVKQWTSEKLKGPLGAADLLSDFIGEHPYGSAVIPRQSAESTPEQVIDVPASPVTVQKAHSIATLPPDMPESTEEGPDIVKVAVRLPQGGTKKQIKFRANQPLSALRDWVSATEQIPVFEFEVRLSHPPRTIDFEDPTQTVGGSGISGNLLLVVPAPSK